MANFRGRAFSTIFSSEINEDQFNQSKALDQNESLSLVQENLSDAHDEQFNKDKQSGLIAENQKKNKEVELVKQDFKDELKNEKEKISRLEDDLKNKFNEINDLHDQLDTKINEIELLQKAIAEKDNLINNAENNLKEQIEVYELKVSTLNEKLEFTEAQIITLKKEIEDFENRQVSEETEAIETVVIDVNEISSVQEELTKAQDKIRNLEDLLNQSRTEYTILEGFVSKLGLDGGAGELKKAQKVIQQLNYIIQKQKEFIKDREAYITRIKIGIRETTEQLLNENTPPYIDVTTETLPVMEEFVTVKEQEQIMTKIINHMQFVEDNFSRKLEEEKTIKTDLENEKHCLLEKVDYLIERMKIGESDINNNTAIPDKNEADKEVVQDEEENAPAVDKPEEIINIVQNEVIDETTNDKPAQEKIDLPQKQKSINQGDKQMDEIIKKIASEELENFQTIYEKNFSLDEAIKIVKSSIEQIPIKKLKGEQLNNEERRLNGKIKEYSKLLAATA